MRQCLRDKSNLRNTNNKPNQSRELAALYKIYKNITYLFHNLNDHYHKISAICIQETWLSDQENSFFSNYKATILYRNHGHVGIYLSDTYDYSELL